MRRPDADLEEKREPCAVTSTRAEQWPKDDVHDVSRLLLTSAAIEKRTFIEATDRD
jgi:hypothetical protein